MPEFNSPYYQTSVISYLCISDLLHSSHWSELRGVAERKAKAIVYFTFKSLERAKGRG